MDLGNISRLAKVHWPCADVWQYYITQHPDVEERVLAELRQVYGSSTSAADVDLSQLKYLRQVLKVSF